MSNRLPECWTVSPLGNVLKQIIDFRGRTPKKLGMEWGGGSIRALSANNVQMGKINFQKECYLASMELYQEWMTKGETEKGDVLFTMEAPLGNVALVPNDDKYILSQRVILLKNDRAKVLSDFLFQQMRSDSFQKILRENATGSTALGIQQKRLVTLDIALPPLPEQKKIAAILSSVDDVIEKIQVQIDKLKDLKTGMMQELLTRGVGVDGKPHTEFKDSPVGRIPKGWEVIELESLTKAPICYGIVQVGDYTEGGVPVMAIKNLGRSFSNGINLVSHEIEGKYQRSRVRGGDLLLSVKATVGRVDVVPASFVGNISRDIARIRFDESISSDFAKYFFQSSKGLTLIADTSVGTTRAELSIHAVKKMPFPVPPLDEQSRIASSLIAIDKKISLIESKLHQLESLKKALMQDLLTGKVRVKVDS